eukprot:scaffold8593_cov106-Isochrysis_galbana.AAC.2
MPGPVGSVRGPCMSRGIEGRPLLAAPDVASAAAYSAGNHTAPSPWRHAKLGWRRVAPGKEREHADQRKPERHGQSHAAAAPRWHLGDHGRRPGGI